MKLVQKCLGCGKLIGKMDHVMVIDCSSGISIREAVPVHDKNSGYECMDKAAKQLVAAVGCSKEDLYGPKIQSVLESRMSAIARSSNGKVQPVKVAQATKMFCQFLLLSRIFGVTIVFDPSQCGFSTTMGRAIQDSIEAGARNGAFAEVL